MSSIRARIGARVPTIAGLLGLVSAGLVVGAIRGTLPVGILPRSEALIAAVPHLNAAISVLAIVTIAGGVRAVRRGDVARHRRLMITSFGLFVGFLVLYLYKVGMEGPTRFGGPDAVYRFVYLPVLAVHVVLALASLPLLYYVLLLGFTRPVSELPDTNHPRVGRVAVALWLVSFVLGLVVYLLLYVWFG